MNKKGKIITAAAVLTAAAAAVAALIIVNKKDKFHFEYVKVSEAIQNADSVLGTTYENFTLPDSLNIDVSGELYTISADNLYSTCDREEMSDRLAEIMGSGKKQSSEEEGMDTLETIYENGRVWCHNCRTFTATRRELTVPEGQLTDGKLYVIGRDSLDDKYILNGEEYSIKEAVEYGEKFANEKILPLLINDTKVKVIAACAFKVDEENYWIFVKLQHYMFDCPVSASGSALYQEPFMRPQQLLLTFDGKDQICHVENECYAAVMDKKKIDKIISLPSALKYVEYMLAPESNYTVTRVGLEYCTRIEYNETEFEYHPMWCLTVAEGKGDNINIYPQKVIYVDATNGNLCCFSDMENRMIF